MRENEGPCPGSKPLILPSSHRHQWKDLAQSAEQAWMEVSMVMIITGELLVK
jgi:hypothetical protein